jgi:hypothetical protein
VTEIITRELSEEEIAERKLWSDEKPILDRKAVEESRRQAYQMQSDPLFFGWQRGDNTEAEWLAAVDKIKTDNPYPEETN